MRTRNANFTRRTDASNCEQFLRSDLARPSGEILNNERFFRAHIGGTLVKGRMDRLGADRR